MSNANDVLGYWKIESAYGTPPTGNWQTLRLASDTLETNAGTTISDELGNRRVKDVSRTEQSVAGSLVGRFSYGAFDDWFLLALFADQADTWAAPVTSALAADNTLQATAAGNTLTVAGASKLDWSTIADNRWLRIKGFATNGGEFYCRKVSHAGDVATVDHFTLVNEGPITSGEIEAGGYVSDGNTERSYSYERNYVTPASNYRVFDGLEINTLAMDMRAGSGLINITANMIGQHETFSASSSAGTPVAALTNRLMNGVSHVKAVLIDGSEVALAEFNLDFNNNMRQRQVFGTLGPTSLGAGQFVSGAQFAGYYDGNTQIAKFLADTDTTLGLRFRDYHGNAYVMHWPLGNFTQARALPEASNTDVFGRYAFSAKEYTAGPTDMTVQITKWDV